MWLANLGKERIDEVFDPELAIKRAIDYYRNRGYSDKWIEARLKGILDRNKLTDVWKEDVIDAAHNLKYKFEYLKHFLPFMDVNNFIFISDKSKMKFDIGIDDRTQKLNNCDKKLLFTEFRNENITKEELEKDNIIRVNNWLEVQKQILENLDI